MLRQTRRRSAIIAFAILCSLLSGKSAIIAQSTKAPLVELIPFEFDPRNPERKQFGALDAHGRFSIGFQGQALRRTVRTDNRWRWQTIRHLRPRLLVVGENREQRRQRASGPRRLANRSHAHTGQNSRLRVPRRMPKRWPAPRTVHCSSPLKAAIGFGATMRRRGLSPRCQPRSRFPVTLARAPRNGGLEGLTSLPDGQAVGVDRRVRQSRRQLQGLAARRQPFRGAFLSARQRLSRHRLCRA